MNALIEKLEALVWALKYGRPKRKMTVEKILSHLELIEKPVFFLSTGRCGTSWFSVMLEQDPNVKVLHSPNPSFSVQNAYYYSLWKNSDINKKILLDFGKNLYTTGRGEHLRHLYKSNKRYIETNNHITFFAPVLAKIFPDSLFVHVYRHPGEFVRSGIRRGWFHQNQDASSKMIQPGNNLTHWDSYSQIQKIAWVWQETNQFIEDFKEQLNPNRHITFNFNSKDKDSLDTLFSFIEVGISYEQLGSRINQRINSQSTGDFPRYADWTEKNKKELMAICGKLAQDYGYLL